MAHIYKISASDSIDAGSHFIQKAVEYLRGDGIIAMPSDTLYGLFARFNSRLIEKLHKIKNRGKEKPFILVFPENATLNGFVGIDRLNLAQISAMKKFWPGKNTLILPKNPGLDYPQKDVIAVRVPKKEDNPFFYNVLGQLGEPLLAPSLNIHNEEPLSSLKLMAEQFGDSIEAVFFDETFRPGSPSRLIDLMTDPFQFLR